jgi:hypothetical protein
MKRVNAIDISSSNCDGSSTAGSTITGTNANEITRSPTNDEGRAASAAKKNRTSNSNINQNVPIASLQQETSQIPCKYIGFVAVRVCVYWVLASSNLSISFHEERGISVHFPTFTPHLTFDFLLCSFTFSGCFV